MCLEPTDTACTLEGVSTLPPLRPHGGIATVADDQTASSRCVGGLLSTHSTVCCPASCGICGGTGCATLPGGRASCCPATIRATARSCATPTDSSCVIASQVSAEAEAVASPTREWLLGELTATDARVQRTRSAALKLFDRPTLLRELFQTEAAAAKAREELGVLHCKRYGVGPSGGYCLKANHQLVGGNDCLPHALADAMGRSYAGSTVLDLGCGIGRYGAYFAEHHPTVRWLGLDGAEHVAAATNGSVQVRRRATRDCHVSQPMITTHA